MTKATVLNIKTSLEKQQFQCVFIGYPKSKKKRVVRGILKNVKILREKKKKIIGFFFLFVYFLLPKNLLTNVCADICSTK